MKPTGVDVSGATQFEGRTAEEAVARARAALGESERAPLLEDEAGRGRRVLRQGGLRRLAHAAPRVRADARQGVADGARQGERRRRRRARARWQLHALGRAG